MLELQQVPRAMRRLARRRTAAVACALFTAACAGSTEDQQCRSTPPKDEMVYRAELLQARAEKEASYRTDPDSPVPEALRAQLQLSFYPVDPRLRLVGPLVRDARSDTFTIVATSGKRRPIRTVGHFQLDLGAGVERLPVYQLLDLSPESAGHLFVPFMDATSVVETYPAGRYLEVEQTEPGRYLVDFNLAYNPLCAYGGMFNCPITPQESRLRAAVRGGEKGYHQEAPGAAAAGQAEPASGS
jgi:uncharacterized protein (DUF1684 family)